MQHTPDELLAEMAPQKDKDVALAKACIAAMTSYAAELISASPTQNEQRCAEIGKLVETFPGYWGFDEPDTTYIETFADAVNSARFKAPTPSTDEQRQTLFEGLFRYVEELNVCEGCDSYDEIKDIDELLYAVGKFWGYETERIAEISEKLDDLMLEMEEELGITEQDGPTL